MSVHVKAAANRIFQEFRTDLLKGIDEAPPPLGDAFTTTIPSTSRSTMHAWLADQHTVREWKGSRIARSMGSRTWEVVNRPWELTYEFDGDQIDDDTSGLVAQAVMMARSGGAKWARHKDSLIATTLEAGISSVCWDGQFFFDTDHPIDVDGITSGTFDNDLTLALTHANFNTAVEGILGYKNEDNSPMVLPGGLLLVVPPALRLEAVQILEIDTLTPQASYGLFGTGGVSKNPLVGMAQYQVNPYLSDTTRWYLMATGGYVKPLMWQTRRGVEFQEIGTDSELWFNERKIRIGASARHECSYTLPQLALTSKP